MTECPLCGAVAKIRFKLPHTRIWRCPAVHCQLEFAYPQLDASELSEVYRRCYYPSSNGSSTPQYNATPPEVLPQLFQHLSARFGDLRNKTILDYGCGEGGICLEAVGHGVRPVGIEADPIGLARARKHGCFPVYESLAALCADQAAGFDLIILWEVIEHLREPWSDLAELRKFLRPTGSIVIATPNAGGLKARLIGSSWGNYQNPTHFFYFSPASLSAVMLRGGFVKAERWEINFCYPGQGSSRRTLQRLLLKTGLNGDLLFSATQDGQKLILP